VVSWPIVMSGHVLMGSPISDGPHWPSAEVCAPYTLHSMRTAPRYPSLSKKLREVSSNRTRRERGDFFPVGLADMSENHQGVSAGEKNFKRRQVRADAEVILNPASVQRNIKINAHQSAFFAESFFTNPANHNISALNGRRADNLNKFFWF